MIKHKPLRIAICKLNEFLNLHYYWCIMLPFIVWFVYTLVFPYVQHRYYMRQATTSKAYIEHFTSKYTHSGSPTCFCTVFYQVNNKWYIGNVNMAQKDLEFFNINAMTYPVIPIRVSTSAPDKYVSFYK